MSRPIDWSPLVGSDPVPGEPDLVERAGRHYRKVAVAINEAAAKLRRIAGGQDMHSEAVNAFRDSANKVAENISRAYERYEAVGQALSGYAPQLRDAQDESVAALRQAKEAEAAQASAQRAAEAAQGRIDSAAKGADTTADQGDHRRAAGAAQAAGDALEAARTRLQHAVDARDSAAKRAIGGINEIVKDAELNDGWYENWSGVIAQIGKWADRIALAAGVLALLLGWVPILGQILIATALIAAVVSLAAKSIQKYHGDASWRDVVIAAVGVASFGVGKLAMTALRGTARGAKAASSAARIQARPIRGTRLARNMTTKYMKTSHSQRFLPKPAAVGRDLRGFFGRRTAEQPRILDRIMAREATDLRSKVGSMHRTSPDAPEVARHAQNAKVQERAVYVTNMYGHGSMAYDGYKQINEAVSSPASPTADQLNLSKEGELAQPAGAGRVR